MKKQPENSWSGLLKVVEGHALDFTSALYKDLLTRLLPSVQQGDWHSNILLLPFVFTCAATLEATLNDHIVAYLFDEFGPSKYRSQAEGLLTLTLRAKLNCIIPLLSSNQFMIRSSSVHYRSLSKLITLRNELVHSKSFFMDGVSWEEYSNQTKISEQIQVRLKTLSLRNLNTTIANSFYTALRSLDEDFFYLHESGKLEVNELIQKVQ